eukprot:759421-Hanusia_phi.AAC.1
MDTRPVLGLPIHSEHVQSLQQAPILLLSFARLLLPAFTCRIDDADEMCRPLCHSPPQVRPRVVSISSALRVFRPLVLTKEHLDEGRGHVGGIGSEAAVFSHMELCDEF